MATRWPYFHIQKQLTPVWEGVIVNENGFRNHILDGFELLREGPNDPRADSQHQNVQRRGQFVEHLYGDGVFILNSLTTLSMVAECGRLPAGHPRFRQLIEPITTVLMRTIVDNEFPAVNAKIRTSMADKYPEEDIAYRGEIVDYTTMVCLAENPRAATRVVDCSHDFLTNFLDYRGVWYDHHPTDRLVDQNNAVIGTKRGDPKFSQRQLAETILVIPDPMLATGGTDLGTVDAYEQVCERFGMPVKIIIGSFIATPEGIRAIRTKYPDTEKVRIYTLRLDRGRSTNLRVFQSVPGTYPDEERALTDDDITRHYIVPGAGGWGEKTANAFNAAPISIRGFSESK